MKLIKPSFEIIEQLSGEEEIYKQIELAGRVCWKSENKIAEDSYKNFIEMLKSKQHLSVLEHGTVYLKYDIIEHRSMNMANKYYYSNKYSKVVIGNEPLHGYETPEYKERFNGHTCAYITTNYRVLVENNWLDDLKYLCEPTENHQKRITVRFILDRAIANEFVRHRVFSFAQESTRYCNYSKDKFSNEVTFIIPCWLEDLEEGNIQYKSEFIDQKWLGPNNTEVSYEWLDNEGCAFYPNMDEHLYLKHLESLECCYLELLDKGWTPQQARAVLPNSLKTELVMTGFVDDWKHFFELRCAESAHPQARELAEPLYSEFVKRGYL